MADQKLAVGNVFEGTISGGSLLPKSEGEGNYILATVSSKDGKVKKTCIVGQASGLKQMIEELEPCANKYLLTLTKTGDKEVGDRSYEQFTWTVNFGA